MQAPAGKWLKLTPENLGAVPNAAGVFEVANLVRTVLIIERGEGRLRERIQGLSRMSAVLPAMVGGHYFRFELARPEDEALERRLRTYRAQHRGCLPPGNQEIDQSERTERLRAA